jgi:hypothetical protein
MFVPDLKTDLPRSTKTKKMKNNLLTLATILTIGFFTNNVTAQTSTTGTIKAASVGAVILQPLTIANSQGLHFGTIISNASTTGTVTIATDGTRSVNGAALSLSGSTPHTVAKYTTAGPADALYHITLPTNSEVKVSNGTAADDMTVTGFTADFDAAGTNSLNGTLSSTGTGAVQVGATLNLAAGQVAGIYTGSFNVSVDFN